MNKEENNFEEFLRSKLENHTVEVSNSVWDHIEKKKQKRDIFVWFRQHLNIFIALDLVFISGLAALSLLNLNEVQSKNNTKNTSALATNYQSYTSTEQTEQINTIAIDEAPVNQVIEDKPKKKNETTVNENKASVSIKTSSKVNEDSSATIFVKKEKLNQKQNQVQANQVLNQTVHKKVSEENSADLTTAYASIPLMAMQSISNHNTDAININESLKDPDFLAPSILLSKSKKVIKAEQKAIEKAQASLNANTKSNTAALKEKESQQAVSNANAAEEAVQGEEVAPLALDTVYGKKKFKGYLAVDALISPEIAGRILTGSNPQVNNYIARRDSAEKMRLAYSALMRMNLFINRNVFINTGISFSQRKEKFSILHQWQTNEEYIDSSKFVTYVDPFEGNIIYKTYDTLNSVRTTKETVNHQLVMSFVDIPAMIGYKWLGKRTGIAIQGGVIFNLIFKQKGTFADINYSANDVKTDNQNPFESHAGLSLAGGITTNYKLGEQLDLIVEPHSRYILKPVTNAAYPLQQKVFTYGVNIGLRLKL